MADLAIAYRVYPKVSKEPIAHSTDKFRLAELGLASLKRATEGLDVAFYAIVDGCPHDYVQLVTRYFPEAEIACVDGVGNSRTFAMQMEWLCTQQAADMVYLAEDDYFYTGQLAWMIAWLKMGRGNSFVTPFDHLDYYTSELHRVPTRLFYHQHHWALRASTCLTFMTQKQTLIRTRKVFESYHEGDLDVSIFMALTKWRVFNLVYVLQCTLQTPFLYRAWCLAWKYNARQILFGSRYLLYAPIPSIGIHLQKDTLPSPVAWTAEIARFEAHNRAQ